MTFDRIFVLLLRFSVLAATLMMVLFFVAVMAIGIWKELGSMTTG